MHGVSTTEPTPTIEGLAETESPVDTVDSPREVSVESAPTSLLALEDRGSISLVVLLCPWP
jgi:hypothetical protein